MSTKTDSTRYLDAVYSFAVEEEDVRVCKDIPDEACSEVPGNFLRIVSAQSLTKLADEFANAKTVLPWLLGAIGAPAFWVAFLVPVREAFSMLPQMVIAGQIRALPLRKYVWVAGGLAQAASLLALAAVALWVRGAWAGPAVLGLLFLFSLARGLCSIASKDVTGKTIPKTRRGRVTGYAATVSGVLTLAASGVLVGMAGADAAPAVFAGLLAAGAGLWILATGVFVSVAETPGGTAGGKSALDDLGRQLSLFRDDAPFRRFVIVRALLISTALSAPYFIVLARENGGGGGSLGFFVMASGLASAVSSAVWGRYADRSSRQVLITAAAVASATGLALAALHFAGVLSGAFSWAYPAAFFLLSIAHSGVRVGRKTYVLDLAGGKKRTDYVAVSNTVIGAILLASGALGALTPLIGPAGMLVLLSSISTTGVVAGTWLPETEVDG